MSHRTRFTGHGGLDSLACSAEASSGTILFGGYDFNQVIGNIQLLDMLPDDDGVHREYLSQWTYLALTNNIDLGNAPIKICESGFQAPALFDSGTTLTYIPGSQLNSLSSYLNIDNYQIPCDVRTWARWSTVRLRLA